MRRGDSLCVFSLNVWFEQHLFDRRVRAISALIKASSPDIVCLQEVTPDFVLQMNKDRLGSTESHWLNDYLCSDHTWNGSTVAPYGVMMLVKNSLGVSPSSFEFTGLPTNMDRQLLSVEIPILVDEIVSQGKEKGKDDKDISKDSVDAAIEGASDSTQEQSSTFSSVMMTPIYSLYSKLSGSVPAKKSNTICVSTVHLESLSFPATRAQQLRTIHDYQMQYEYAIIAGDFNFCSYLNYKDMYCSTQYFTREERSQGISDTCDSNTSGSKVYGGGSHRFGNVGNNLLENDVLQQVLPEYIDVWCHVHNIDNDAAIAELKANQFKRSHLRAEDRKYGYTFDEVTNLMVHKQRYATNPNISLGSSERGSNKSKAGALRVPKAPCRPSKKQARIDEDGEPLSGEPVTLNVDQLSYFAEAQISERMRYDRIMVKSNGNPYSSENKEESVNNNEKEKEKNAMYLQTDSIVVVANKPISDLDEETSTSTAEKEKETEGVVWDDIINNTNKEGSNKENAEKNDGYSSPTPESVNRHKGKDSKNNEGGIYSSPQRESQPVVYPSDHYGLLAKFSLMD